MEDAVAETAAPRRLLPLLQRTRAALAAAAAASPRDNDAAAAALAVAADALADESAGSQTTEYFAACDALAHMHAHASRHADAAAWLARALAGAGALRAGSSADDIVTVDSEALARRPGLALDVWKLAQLRWLAATSATARASARSLARAAEPQLQALLPRASPVRAELAAMLASGR